MILYLTFYKKDIYMLNVMIVDDSLIMRKKLKQFLKELGHNIVIEAKTGAEAIEFYEKYMPDLVTMDITMPDMDGITAVKQIKQNYPDTKIIMATSHGQEKMVREALISGAKGYILKPISKDKLKNSIHRIFYKVEDLIDDEDLLDD